MTSLSLIPQRLWKHPHFLLGVALFLLAFLPRLLWALGEHPRPFSDMEDYFISAVNFVRGGYLAQSPDRLAYRAPLYPLFLAFCIKFFTFDFLLAIRLIQSFIGSLSVLLLYDFARQVLPVKPLAEAKTVLHHPYLLPFAIALTFAWMGGQIFMCSVLMSETLNIFVILLWACIGIRCKGPQDYWKLCLFSMLIGVQALIRPISIFFLPLLLWKILQCIPRPQWPKWIWFPLFGWTLPIIPWTLRNYLVLNAFVLISTNSGVNFFLGHNPAYSYYDVGYKEHFRREYVQLYGHSEVGEDRYLLSKGMEYIREQPWNLLPRTYMKLYFLFILDKEPWPWEEYNGGRGMVMLWDLRWPLIWWNYFYFILFVAGVVCAWFRGISQGFMLSTILLYTLACAIYFARTRFRMPIEPFMLLYVWITLASLADAAIWRYGIFRRSKSEIARSD